LVSTWDVQNDRPLNAKHVIPDKLCKGMKLLLKIRSIPPIFKDADTMLKCVTYTPSYRRAV